jgi:hypothetical protein
VSAGKLSKSPFAAELNLKLARKEAGDSAVGDDML